MRWLVVVCWIVFVVASGSTSLTLDLVASDTDGQRISFRNDVVPVLSKAGCNQGVCHGNKNGKGGFRLSLRGQDPLADYDVLTRELAGRRVDRQRPDRSLLLLKALGAVPHGGGPRFRRGSLEEGILSGWIRSGLDADDDRIPRLVELRVSPERLVLVEPAEQATLQVTARFSDGSEESIERLACYESSNQKVRISESGTVERAQFGESTVIVRYQHLQRTVSCIFVPERPGWTASVEVEESSERARFIDERVFSKLRELRLTPAPRCDDATFLRRVCLDLHGRLPSIEEGRRFVRDASPEKRRRLVDELLADHRFADFWALKWSDLLRNEEKVLDRKGVQSFHRWIREAIDRGMPLDRFVRSIVGAEGSTYTQPATNYWRALRDPISRAESTAQVFLGVRLRCAKCHNHPFDRWTQDDYYSWATLFSRVRYKILENRRRDSNDKHEFVGEQVVWFDRQGDVEDPRTGRAPRPALLGATFERVTRDSSGLRRGEDDYLAVVADWITRPDNPWFARGQVNRIWFHLLGRGIVDPVDDFRATNPPSHPELLDELAAAFVRDGFDLRSLIRRIIASRAYQCAAFVEGDESLTPSDRESLEINYGRALSRRLTAEQLLDSVARVVGSDPTFAGYPAGHEAVELAGTRPLFRGKKASGDEFLKLFGKPDRLLTCECERSSETTLSQALALVSGPVLHGLLGREDNRLAEYARSEADPSDLLDELFWSTLTRSPSKEESRVLSELIAAVETRQGDALETDIPARDEAAKRRALEDIVWSLLNSKEFLFRP